MKRTQEQSEAVSNQGLPPKKDPWLEAISTKVRDSIISIIKAYQNEAELRELFKKWSIQELCDDSLRHKLRGHPEDAKGLAKELTGALITREANQHTEQTYKHSGALNSGQMHNRLADHYNKPRGKTLYLHAVAAGATDIARILVSYFGKNIANDVERTEHPDPKSGLCSKYKTALHIAIEALPALGIDKFKNVLRMVILEHKMNVRSNGFIRGGWEEITEFVDTHFARHPSPLYNEAKNFLLTFIEPKELTFSHEPINKEKTLAALHWSPDRPPHRLLERAPAPKKQMRILDYVSKNGNPPMQSGPPVASSLPTPPRSEARSSPGERENPIIVPYYDDTPSSAVHGVTAISQEEAYSQDLSRL